MQTFFITFGQRFKYEAHPVLGFMPQLPDGVLTIKAEHELAARVWLRENFANSTYAFIYNVDEWPEYERYYPRGILGDVVELVTAEEAR